MNIKRVPTYYGYDLLINNILHKRCLCCKNWYEFDGIHGYCEDCLFQSSTCNHDQHHEAGEDHTIQ